MRQNRLDIFISKINNYDRNVFGINVRDDFVPEALLVRAVEIYRGNKFNVVYWVIIDFFKQLFHLVPRADKNGVVRMNTADNEITIHPPRVSEREGHKKIYEQNSFRSNTKERNEVEKNYCQCRIYKLSTGENTWQLRLENRCMFLV